MQEKGEPHQHIVREVVKMVGIVGIGHLYGLRFGDFAETSLSILTQLEAKSPNFVPERSPMIPSLYTQTLLKQTLMPHITNQ